MTDEQINIAIAESLGWKQCQHCATHGLKAWRYPTDDGCTDTLPNYTADLNACHELEKTVMLNSHTRLNYLSWLGWENDYASTVFACVHSTASQRCEAYLRAIGKWIE